MTPVVSAAIAGGVVAALIAFLTAKGQNRKAHAEAYKAETQADNIIISNLRDEVTRLSEGQAELRDTVDTLIAKLEECEEERDRFKKRLDAVEAQVNGKIGGRNG